MRRLTLSTIPTLWQRIRYSYWFIPTLMALGALGLAFGLLQLDRIEEDGLISELGWVYTGSSDGAREVLSVIAGSMITVAGVVFSITMVALTLASSQFGPRVLRNFMQDRGSQIVLGTFIATFVYSLIVLRTIHGGDESFVPQLSVTASVVMALGSLGVLIYFIHHVALSIQGSQIVALIGQELLASIDKAFPERGVAAGHADAPHDLPEHFEAEAATVTAASSGYLQAVDLDALVDTAREAGVVLRLACRPGDFISPYKPLLLCWPARRCQDGISDRLTRAFTTGTERSHTQDVRFAVDQLVEVAVRALSPGINDPFTAVRCLDWLGPALARCLSRRPSPAYRRDEDGTLRLVLEPVTFDELADAAFGQIQEYGLRSATVMIHMLHILHDVARYTRTPGERDVVLRHARQVLRSQSELVREQDRERMQNQYQEVLYVLHGEDDPLSAVDAPYPRRD